MKKKWLLFILFMALLMASLPNSVVASQLITVILNDEQLQFDVRPVLENGRVLVPLRAIFEALGAVVDYDATTETIIATKGQTRIRLQTFATHGFRNGEAIPLNVPAKVIQGRTMVPLKFVSEALGAGVEWDTESRMVKINQEGGPELEQAKEQVKEYLSLLDRAVREGVTDKEWTGILSQAAINSGYGADARVFRPVPGLVGSSGRSVSDVEITKAEYATGSKSDAFIIVTARYTYSNPTEPDASRQKIQYEKQYNLIWENEQLVIDGEQTQALRYADDIPLVILSERDIEQITQQWQQDNYYNYNEVIAINNSFISPILSETLGIIKWGNTSTPSGKERLDQLLSYFSANVKESNGWKEFISFEAKRDPEFTVLWVTSSQNYISATLFGNLFPGFEVIPAIMDIEIEKQPDSEQWLFTKIEKVRAYESLEELKQQESQTYDLIVQMESYRQQQRISINLD